MSDLRQRFPRTREKKHAALTAYAGDYASLAAELGEQESRQRIRTYSETAYDEVIGALQLLGRISGSVTIIHGPPGCGAVKLEDYLNRSGSSWIITNIEENDSILGADDKLGEAVERAYRVYRPEIIFILATPVIAINNDDIQSIIVDKSDSLGIPVVPVYAAGFRSKTSVYGYDLVYHALAKYVLSKEAPESPAAAINLFGTAETHTDHIVRDLAGAGVFVNLAAGTYSLSVLRTARQAIASIAIDNDNALYLLHWLEEEYGITHLRESAPIGIRSTERWLLAAARIFGSAEIAEAYIEAEKNAADSILNSRLLSTASVFIDLPPQQAFGVSGLITELGGRVAGVAVSHIDRSHADTVRELQAQRPDTPVYVQQGQPFEKVNLLKKLAPDLYIGRSEDAVWAVRAGIPAVAIDHLDIYGFAGAKALSSAIANALRNNALSRYAGEGGELPYRNNWLNRSSNWHIKQEVK
ncbi:nitrogenase component 1 [Paenibacillus sp. S150]|nr:nitrogenase component 1 [Paenibacillus sp. S150]